MRTTLRPVAFAFSALGVFLGCWAVVAADLEHALGVGHGGFGLLLAVALCGTAASGAVTGSLVERHGTSRVLMVGLALFGLAGLAMVAAITAPPPVLAATIIVAFACSGSVDVTMNVASAAALADQPGRLVRFHAFFNAGAAAGAALTAAVVHLTGEWRWTMLIPVVFMFIASLRCRGAVLPAGEAGEEHGLLHAVRTVRSEGLVPLAVVFACGAVVEGGIDTWGVLVLREQLAIGLAAGATAYFVGQVVATTGRSLLGPAAGSLGTVRGIALGAGLAAGGLLAVAIAPAPLAVAGLVVAAGGISVCWPMLIAHASQGLDRPAGVVSGVTSIGYVGFVIGPAIIGLAAEVVGLRSAILLLVGLAGFVAVAPRRLRPPARRVTSAG